MALTTQTPTLAQQQWLACLERAQQEHVQLSLLSPAYRQTRTRAVDWCWRLGTEFDLSNLTLHTAVRLMDACQQFPGECCTASSLLSVGCLVLSCTFVGGCFRCLGEGWERPLLPPSLLCA